MPPFPIDIMTTTFMVREHGNIDHLLTMLPLPTEIMLPKVWCSPEPNRRLLSSLERYVKA